MLVLALDTTTRRGSVALLRDGAVLDVDAGDAALTHAQRLPGDIVRLLDRQTLAVRDIDLFAVASGPGSFTGLRIGIATLQGLAFGTGRDLIGISALDAWNETQRVAPIVAPARRQVAAWMDAQRGELFAALYDAEALIDGPLVGTALEILARWHALREEPSVTFAGDGACSYADVIRQALPSAEISGDTALLAPAIARLAEREALSGRAQPPGRIRPLYVRRSDVELARDRKGRR